MPNAAPFPSNQVARPALINAKTRNSAAITRPLIPSTKKHKIGLQIAGDSQTFSGGMKLAGLIRQQSIRLLQGRGLCVLRVFRLGFEPDFRCKVRGSEYLYLGLLLGLGVLRVWVLSDT